METIGLNSKQFIKLAKKFGENVDIDKLSKLKNGDLLCIKKNVETGKEIAYVLHEIYFRKFGMKYSCNHKIKKGGEMLISNFELPKEKILLK